MGRGKPAKYSNRKVHYDGLTFDSIREFERYQELKLMEQAGVISDLVLQPRIQLKCGGKPVMQRSTRYHRGRKVYYIADFEYFDIEQGRKRIEDVKGYDTPLSKLKRAVVETEDGIEIEIVR